MVPLKSSHHPAASHLEERQMKHPSLENDAAASCLLEPWVVDGRMDARDGPLIGWFPTLLMTWEIVSRGRWAEIHTLRKVSVLPITSKDNLFANLSFKKEEMPSGSQLVSCWIFFFYSNCLFYYIYFIWRNMSFRQVRVIFNFSNEKIHFFLLTNLEV